MTDEATPHACASGAIVVHMHPEEHARTPEKSCVYEAVCTIDGVLYSARSRFGAASELARVLVAAGIPDGAMVVTDERFRGALTYRSFYRVAQWTYRETAAKPLHRARWEDPAVKQARIDAASGPKQRVTALAGSTDAAEAVATQNPLLRSDAA